MGTVADEVIRIAPALQLHAPGGEELQVREVRARIVYDGGALRDVQLWFDVTPEDWARIDAGHWFHLDPEVRGPCFAGGFHDRAPITIEARLGTDQTTLISLVGEGIWEIGAVLYGGELHPAVHQTESWYALVVKQPRGPVSTGFMTTYGGWKPPSAAVDPDAGDAA